MARIFFDEKHKPRERNRPYIFLRLSFEARAVGCVSSNKQGLGGTSQKHKQSILLAKSVSLSFWGLIDFAWVVPCRCYGRVPTCTVLSRAHLRAMSASNVAQAFAVS